MYDTNGNMLSDGTNSFTWDARNQLASMSLGAFSFQYNAFGRRTGKTILGMTTNYLYDGVNVAQELAGTTATANLLSGGIDEVFSRTDSIGTANFLADALGSTLALTDSSGNTLSQYTYEPFGNTTTTGASTNPYQYTGRENDGTGLYFYRARYYNPTLQRFISEDPLGFVSGNTNFYAYTLQNPVNFRDPFGLRTIQLGGNVSGDVPIWGPVGLGASLYGGIAYDGSHWAWYWGGGLGPGGGAGVSGGVTVGGSDAHSVCGLRGLFGNLSGSGGAGWGGGAASFFGKDSQGNTVLGGDVMVGGAAGAGGALEATYTWVKPLGGRYTCPN